VAVAGAGAGAFAAPQSQGKPVVGHVFPVACPSTVAFAGAGAGAFIPAATSATYGAPPQKALNASKIGRYPVHLHRFPPSASSISIFVGCGLVLTSAYIAMTNPGVQNPHCEPCACANLF